MKRRLTATIDGFDLPAFEYECEDDRTLTRILHSLMWPTGMSINIESVEQTSGQCYQRFPAGQEYGHSN